jgi:hypothetical protein
VQGISVEQYSGVAIAAHKKRKPHGLPSSWKPRRASGAAW